MKIPHILVINPGSTSTKIAIYEGRKQIYLKNIKHEQAELAGFAKVAYQFEFRKNIILHDLHENRIKLKSINLVMGRGGLLKPIPGGAYRVNDAMIRDIHNPMAEHESNLGGIIAYEIAKAIGPTINAYIVDPTCVDELEEIARISGLPELPRKSFLHTLNQKAVARRHAKELGKRYEDMNLIVAHMGGGITVGAHKMGRIIDVNNGLNGDGPFSPERSGGLPVGQLVDLCFSGKYSREEIHRMIKGKGGMVAYLGTNNAIEVEDRIKNGDNYAKLIYDAMAYQVGKEIGALSAIFEGRVDTILLTGGVAYSDYLTEKIRLMVDFIAPVQVYPGEDEMAALAYNGWLILNGELIANEYE
jgi:butyrate kinase